MTLLARMFSPKTLGVITSRLLLLVLATIAVPVHSYALPQQQIQAALRLLESQQYSQALILLQNLETRLPQPDQVAGLIATAHLGKGFKLLAAGDILKARQSFQDGKRYAPDDVRFWQGEARSWSYEGQYAVAASLLNQALGIAPDNPDLYHGLGRAYYDDGRMAEALDALNRASELGGGEEVTAMLTKVRREWQVEQEMGQEVRGHFHLSYVDDGHIGPFAQEIVEVLEDAYTDLGSELAYYPDVRVPVLLYSRKNFSALTSSPHWAGAMYDGKIRLPLAGVKDMSEQFAALLYHEYMHVMVHFLANRHAPVWLNEGLAEVAERRIKTKSMAALQKAVKGQQLLDWATLSGPFASLDSSLVPLAYEQSYALVDFMVESFGWHKMTDLLARIGKAQDWQTAVAQVYQDYGLDWPAILDEWQASLE